MYQTGGSQQGRIDFTLQPFHERQSQRMGVSERIYNPTIRQTGPLIPQQSDKMVYIGLS